MKEELIIFFTVLILAFAAAIAEAQPAPEAFDNRTIEQDTVSTRAFELRLGGSERLYPVTQGSLTPSPGTLFNIEAVAWLDAYMGNVHLYYMNEMNYRLNEVRTEARFRITSMELRLRTTEENHEARIINLQDNLNTCNENLRISLTGDASPTPSRRTRGRARRRMIFITIGTALGTAVTSSYATYIYTQRN